jgi:hypothetical protein
MAVDRFAALNKLGVKGVALRQADHIGRLKQPEAHFPDADLKFSHENHRHLEHGICAGLSVNWLKEKLTTSNSRFRPAPKNFVRSPSASRIDSIMHAGALQQLIHGRDFTTLSALLDTHGIDTDELAIPQRKGADHTPYPLIDKGFECACAAMKPGEGTLMVSSVYQAGARLGGHATALYKSHGGKLYFFDPNVGAYTVNDPAQFVAAWAASYAARNQSVAIDGGGNDGFFTCTLRKAAAAGRVAP